MEIKQNNRSWLFLLLSFLIFPLNVNARQQPELKGGLENFINNHKIYPRYSLQNCIDGQVVVAFRLSKNGEVYYSEVRKGLGTDLDDEALRLIRLSSGKWSVPQGYDTTLIVLAPVNFRLSGYDCGNKTREQIQEAISNYKTNVSMTGVVLNFYRNKASGKYSSEEEARIIALKNTLGYDEEYLKQRVEEGRRKLKQKDRQGACEDFNFVKNMGSDLADELLARYCK